MTTFNTPVSAAVAKTAGGRVFNFNAGPSILPEEVIEQMQRDIWDFQGSGFGILEHSHRAKWFQKLLDEAEARVREVGGIPSNYRVLFMTGGSSSQNYMVPMNLLKPGNTGDYIVTGYWAERSFDDAKNIGIPAGTPHLAATSVDQRHSYIPAESQIKYSQGTSYVHITSNNTIYGTQWHRVPIVPPGTPIVVDACSDIFSRPWDVTKFGLVYASAQKNLGVTGTTIVIVRDDLIDGSRTDIPRMLQYRTFAKEQSMPNTPPAFSIYSVWLMTDWIRRQGGLKAIGELNQRKAALVYAALDERSDFYICHARADSRSLMNIVFRTKAGEAADKRFMEYARQRGLEGLAGHRATGGMRASLYNAMPLEGAQLLASVIRSFQ
jgi:phosphoserine aminotransferase